jgi:hypothetical protein
MKIFLDLDGVLCDFDQGVRDLGPEAAAGLAEDAPQATKQVMYDAIEKAGEAWWANLKWTEGGKDLWKIVEKFNPVLLSSPGKFQWASSGKQVWVKNNLPGTSLFLTESKSEYIDPYEMSILIDDNKNNVGAWEESGGEGILYTSTPDMERKFLELLWNVPDLDPSKIYW